MPTRRDILRTGLAAAASAGFAARAPGAQLAMTVAASAAAAKSDGERLTELLDALMQEALRDSPQLMTFTG